LLLCWIGSRECGVTYLLAWIGLDWVFCGGAEGHARVRAYPRVLITDSHSTSAGNEISIMSVGNVFDVVLRLGRGMERHNVVFCGTKITFDVPFIF
jgi:hypothetical protein